ncbi:MAG: hypothetical protein O2798_03935 [Chloroflexi bacterium]|nr:hypothetical protein [Chloroflexota bacterium]MDA1239976.1 hypothetical protein [Chloroflexota bacterium]
MQSRTLRGVLLVTGVALALMVAAACSDDADSTPSPTATGTPDPVATAPTPPEPTKTPDAVAPAAPTNAVITGAIPNLETPIPAGEGESGRISITWVASTDTVDGYRIYQEECGAEAKPALDVPANEVTYGPLNPCRPARVGVAAFIGEVESEIAWGVAAP